jgi:Cu-Zn family superoxide dismutase|tara:strand:+ start:418 stop:945 length:528 start_codon:yes stop_codon:yes gene_type:complete
MEKTGYAALVALLLCTSAAANETQATLHRLSVDGEAEAVGTVLFSDTEHGLLITPALHGLEPAGAHGTHIHTKPACGARSKHGRMMVGAAAGAHYDPADTGQHAGPYGEGHLGDLPNLIAEANGEATIPVLAPRLTVADLKGRSIMIHSAPDHYNDYGDPHHGKGGVRMYCGVID